MNILVEKNTMFRRFYVVIFLFFYLFFSSTIVGSQGTVIRQNQAWLGYSANIAINEKYSWWNDIHYVPNGFFIARTGLSRSLELGTLTAGYAYGLLPFGMESKLQRREHRPWAQIQNSLALPNQFVVIGRFRYDARFRQTVEQNMLTDEYLLVHRMRFMLSLRKFLMESESKLGRPFVAFGNEVLFNFGSNAAQNFDQNRIFLMVGTQHENLQVQTGYMNRFVINGPNSYTNNHTWVLWVAHTFYIRSKLSRKDLLMEDE